MCSVFVTVGTTLFEDLIEEVSTKECLQVCYVSMFTNVININKFIFVLLVIKKNLMSY